MPWIYIMIYILIFTQPPMVKTRNNRLWTWLSWWCLRKLGGFSFSKRKTTLCFRFANWILENAGKGKTARSGSTRQLLNRTYEHGVCKWHALFSTLGWMITYNMMCKAEHLFLPKWKYKVDVVDSGYRMMSPSHTESFHFLLLDSHSLLPRELAWYIFRISQRFWG